MRLLSASVAALFGVKAQDATPRIRTTFMDSPYDISLPCGECVASGHNFVWRTVETGLVVNDEEYPTNTGKYADTDVMCCEGSFDRYKDTDYVPSSTPPPEKDAEF